MKILFMCVANSARSQMAEGLARRLLPTVEIQSAGSQPGKLNPFAVAVMKEIGVDISNHYSKSYNDLPTKFTTEIDYVITLCAEEVCPTVVSKAKKLHWPFIDPASKEPISDEDLLKSFRGARDSIEKKLKFFRQEIGAEI